MDDTEDPFLNLQTKLNDALQRIDDLEYMTNKKLGSSSNSIYGSQMQSVNFRTGVSGWTLTPDGNLEANNGNFRGDITGATGTFSGTVTVGSLNIPDTTTTPSFHVKTDGKVFGGANLANEANALWSITAAGAVLFKNVQVGGTTYQYTINDKGVYTFGDTSDSAATFDGSATPAGSTKSTNDYTLTRDVYYTDMTMSTGTTLNPAGFRIFVSGTLTMNGTAIIKTNGGSGGNASGITHGNAGSALADGYLKGSTNGHAGADGADGTSTDAGSPGTVNGSNTSNSLGSNGVSGGTAGNGGAGTLTSPGGTGGSGAGGTATAPNVALRAGWHLQTLLDISSTGATVKYDNSAQNGGGGGGAGGGRAIGNLQAGSGGGGGGSGTAGGIIAIFARSIVIGASAAIQATGGNGGNGANGTQSPNTGGGGGGGGGGGAGGNGGILILVYNTITNSGALTVTGGTKGTKGTGGASNGAGAAGTNGADGTNGTTGTIYQFVVSL